MMSGSLENFFYRHAASILSIIVAFVFLTYVYIQDTLGYSLNLQHFLSLIIFNILIVQFFGRIISRLYNRSNMDPLTGLHNRSFLYGRLNYEMERLKRVHAHLSIVIIDVDNFKSINDTYGHLEGDKVLREMSLIFTNLTRTTDTVARWGGEEFMIILPNTDRVGTKVFAERIRSAVESQKLCEGATICLGLNSTTKYLNVEEFIASADKALYKAKETRNSVVDARFV